MMNRLAKLLVAVLALHAILVSGCDSGDEQECFPECDPDEQCYEEGCRTPCGHCIDTQCYAEASACDRNPQCPALLSCMVDCGSDDACMDRCGNNFAGGIGDLLNIFDCMDLHCEEECISD